MRYAYDFRKIAREALRGRWGIAVIAGVVASLLGAAASIGPKLELNISDSGKNVNLNLGDVQLFTTAETAHFTFFPGFKGLIVGGAALVLLAALAVGVLYFILGSVVAVGYSGFNLDLVDGQKTPEIGSLFNYFPHWKTTAAARFLRGLWVFLWSLLFIIPGIIAGYSYAMAEYILAEHPELTAGEALQQSKEMMYGNRWRLFCLEFSFIGWDLLASLTLGVGGLWLNPYKKAAEAAFYREISGTEYVVGGNGSGGFAGE